MDLQQQPTTVIALAIPPPSRVRVGFCLLFAFAYAVGAFAMGMQFHNSAAAGGFALTTVMVLLYVVLLKHHPVQVQQCTFLSITRRGLFLFMAITVASLAASVYWLYSALNAHEQWNGDSQFCAFIAFLMAAKWAVCCAVRVRFFREVARMSVVRGMVVTGVAVQSGDVTGINYTQVAPAGSTVVTMSEPNMCPFKPHFTTTPSTGGDAKKESDECKKLLP